MKRLIILLGLVVLFGATAATAQTEETFNKIRISSGASVEIRQGETPSISREDNSGGEPWYNLSNDGWLTVTGSQHDEIVITVKDLEKVIIAGSGKVESKGVIKTDNLELSVSGIGKIEMDVECKSIKCDISGAGKIELEGTGDQMIVDISGSGKIDAGKFKVKNCTANISGSGKCFVDVTDELTSNISGIGSVNYVTRPAIVNSSSTGVGHVGQADSEHSDTTRITLGNKHILIIEPDNEVNDILKLERSDKLKAHWAGFELGVNMLVDKDFSTTPPAGYDYLDPKIEKSIAVNFNVADWEFNLSHDKRAMMLTGIGFSINNYRFKSDAFLIPDADSLTASFDGSVYKKNKLMVQYLTVPLLFEFNTSTNPKRTFHFTTGVIGGLRIGSHQKLVKETGSDNYTVKTFDDFNLNPFKADATVRLGYGNFTVFGTYSLIGLFRDKKGPEMFPVTAGIRLVGW